MKIMKLRYDMSINVNCKCDGEGKKGDYALVFGASVVDIFGFSTSDYIPFNSTPGAVKMSFGGVCRNIAENMARIGVHTKFISIIGNDETGRSMVEHSIQMGYDMTDSLVLEDCGTPTYLAILNEDGEMVSAIADMKSIKRMTTGFVDSKAEIIRGAEYTFLDADNPEILEYILTTFKGQTKFILDPISAVKADSIKHLIKHFHTIKPNRHEAEVLAGFELKSDWDLKKAADYFRHLGVVNVFISLDEDGIFYYDGTEHGRIKAQNVQIKNVTGAGDAFVAGLGHGYLNDMPIIETAKFAMAMSIIAIQHEETINPNLDIEYVQRVMKETQWEVITY